MSHTRRTAGFTLIELMLVMVVIGLLAAIAIPKFTDTKARAYVASMRSDLATLALQQETFFFNNRGYGPSTLAVGMSASNGISLTLTESSNTGWSATTSHAATAMRCGVFYGSAVPVAPAVTVGVINCQ